MRLARLARPPRVYDSWPVASARAALLAQMVGKDVKRLTAKQLDKFGANVWLMRCTCREVPRGGPRVRAEGEAEGGAEGRTGAEGEAEWRGGGARVR